MKEINDISANGHGPGDVAVFKNDLSVTPAKLIKKVNCYAIAWYYSPAGTEAK